VKICREGNPSLPFTTKRLSAGWVTPKPAWSAAVRLALGDESWKSREVDTPALLHKKYLKRRNLPDRYIRVANDYVVILD
jgi:hypothetical protein